MDKYDIRNRYLYTFKDLEFMFTEIPPNRPLYFNGGRWEVRSKDMKTIFYVSEIHEDFYKFIKRVFDTERELQRRKTEQQNMNDIHY